MPLDSAFDPRRGTPNLPDDPSLWIDNTPGSVHRPILFYCKRNPVSVLETCTLIEIPSPSGTRAILQVWGYPYKGHYVYIKLYGKVLALNAIEKSPPLPAYHFPDMVSIPDGMPAVSIIKQIAQRGNLDHLVLHAHGTFVEDVPGSPSPSKGIVTCWLGEGLSTKNLDLWDQLKGNIKYIWLMNCRTGVDRWTCGTLAMKTQAWVTAPNDDTLTRPRKLPAGHIEYFEHPTLLHWNGKRFSPGETQFSPDLADTFFRSARKSSAVSVEEAGLYFNIVGLGPRY